MCSILGVFDLRPGADLHPLRPLALSLSARQRHRGPDWSGVHVDANARVLTGTVGEISPQVDAAARAFVVKVDLPSDALEGLNAGMFARVHFPRQARDALTVPLEAVSARGSLDRVFVVDDSIAELRLVTLGAVQGDRVAVLSGLSRGEVVVVAPPSSLRDRDRVEVSQ